MHDVAVTLKFTVHVVQSFIKGHRKSGVISIEHSRELNYSGIMYLIDNYVEGEHNRTHAVPSDRSP